MRLVPVLLAALLAGCAATPPAPVPSATVPVSASAAPATSVLTGVAVAPPGILGRVVPTGGGHLISDQGGSVVPTGGGRLRLLALDEAPLANATAFLADAAGNAYPALAPVQTDAQGRFTFPAVPAGRTFMVVVAARDQARAKDCTLQTLVRSSDLGASTTVNAASALVTLAVTQDQGGELGAFNAAAFRTATEATGRALAPADLPDLSDRSAVLAKVEALATGIAELKQALAAIRQDLADIKDQLADIKAAVDARPSPPPPPPARGGCDGGPPIAWRLALTKTYGSYPLTLAVKEPNGTVIATATFKAAGQRAEARFMPTCAVIVELRDAAGQVVASVTDFKIPAGGSQDQDLPF